MSQLPLNQAISRFVSNEDRVDRFVNGAVNDSYVTEQGHEVPSIRKIASDATARLNATPIPIPIRHRPGDAPFDFTKELLEGEQLGTPISDGELHYADNGKVVRLHGAQTLATRHLFPLEPSRRYLAQFVIQRRVNSTDPASDAVQLALAWHGQNKERLGGEFAEVVVRNLVDVTTGSGRRTVKAIVSRSAGANVQIYAPANARYVRPFVKTFGTSVQTDVEIISWIDITDAQVLTADIADLEDRLTAQESINAGDRLEAVEGAVNNPKMLTLLNRGTLQATDVAVGIEAVTLISGVTDGDGLGGVYRRSIPSTDLQSLDGAFWQERNPLSLEPDEATAIAGLDARLAMSARRVKTVFDSKPDDQPGNAIFNGVLRARSGLPSSTGWTLLGSTVKAATNAGGPRTVISSSAAQTQHAVSPKVAIRPGEAARVSFSVYNTRATGSVRGLVRFYNATGDSLEGGDYLNVTALEKNAWVNLDAYTPIAPASATDFDFVLETSVDATLVEFGNFYAAIDASAKMLPLPTPAYLRKRKTLRGLGISTSQAASQTAAINAALTELQAGDYVDGQNETFRIDTPVLPTNGLILENVGCNISNVAPDVYPLALVGSLGAGLACSTPLEKGRLRHTVSSTAGLSIGQWVFFRQQCGWPATIASVTTNASIRVTVPSGSFFLTGQFSAFGERLGLTTVVNPTTVDLAMSNTSGLSAGQTGYLSNHHGFGFDSQFNTWWGQVRSIVNGTQFETEEAYNSRFLIPAQSLTVYAPTMPVGNRFHNVSAFRETAGADYTHFFEARFARSVFWEGGTITNAHESARRWTSSIDFKVRDAIVLGSAQDGYGYGDIVTNGCEDFWIGENRYIDVRHGVAVGNTGGIDRNGWGGENQIRGSRLAGLDCHAHCENITYENNNIQVMNRFRSGTEQREGMVIQGANCKALNNVIRGVGNQTTDFDSYGLLAQPLTRMPFDTFEARGNTISDIGGAKVIGILYQQQKPAGTGSVILSDNTVIIQDYGSNGNTSPVGIQIETNDNGGPIQNALVNDNLVLSRTTALRLKTTANRVIQDAVISSNKFEIINTDAPVIEFTSITAGGVENAVLDGNMMRGGSHALKNSNAGRIKLGLGNKARGYAIGPIDGTFEGFYDVITFNLGTVTNGLFYAALNLPFSAVVTQVASICRTGTCTATVKLGGVALGGAANSVSSSYQERDHNSHNIGNAPFSVSVEITNNTSCADLSLGIRYYRRDMFEA